MQTHQDINLAEFLSVLIYVSEECGKVIRKVKETGGHKVTASKDDESPVTEADLIVQKTIEVCLNTLYPTLRVEGEESPESIKQKVPAVSPEQITNQVKSFLTTEFLNAAQEKRRSYINDHLRKTYSAEEIQSDNFETFNTKDAIVWIDPLDGTSDFVKENFPAVTVLIGLSINGFSRAGVVHNPFKDGDETKSATYFGTGEHGAYRVEYDQTMTADDLAKRPIHYFEPFDHIEGPKQGESIRVAASLQHFSATMQKIIDGISPVEIKRIGGAGNKCNNLAIGNVDCYLHPSPGLKFWDLCAPESLMKGMGGYGTDFKGDRIKYVAGADPNLKGLILAKNPTWHKTITDRLGDEITNIYNSVFNKAPKVIPAVQQETKAETPAPVQVTVAAPVQVAVAAPSVVKEETKEEIKVAQPTIVNVVETPRKKESSMTLTAIGVIAVAAVAGAAFYVIKHKKD